MLEEERRGQILLAIDTRWSWMKRPIHGFAALLHPAYNAPNIFTNSKILDARTLFMGEVVPLELHDKLLEDTIKYSDRRGGAAFASPSCWKRESLLKPLFWWETYGYALPTLQKMALRIVAQDCSSGACERNWSSYSLIHTKIRNRLATRQLERLVYCRSNLHMIHAMHSMSSARQVKSCYISILVSFEACAL